MNSDQRVVFWQGGLSGGNIVLAQAWGDSSWVSELFSNELPRPDAKCSLDGSPHPFDRFAECSETTGAERHRWLLDVHAAESSGAVSTTLVQQYSFVFSGSSRSDRKRSQTVSEAIAFSADTAGGGAMQLTLSGCIRFDSPFGSPDASVAVEAKETLHKVSNDLSIVSIHLDMVLLRLGQLVDEPLLVEIHQSAESAKTTLRQIGQQIRDALRKWR